MKQRSKVVYYVVLLVYVCMSAWGLTLIKIGLGKGSFMKFDINGMKFSLSWYLLLGLFLYVSSFLVSLFIISGINLSVYYPMSAGLVYACVCVLSVLILKESVSVYQGAGMVIIWLGIILMNFKK